VIAACGAALAVAAWVGVGAYLSAPAHSDVGDAPLELHATTVHIPTSSGGTVAGWFVRGQPGLGAILLLHGVRANRLDMLERARFLERAGYSVLLIDLPGHGESTGNRITFGSREAVGIAAALGFLRRDLPGERLGVIGVSLGAASLVLANPRPAPEAVILESMYPTIEEAVADRLAIRFGPAGARLSPLLLWQLPLQLGITARELRPIDKIAALGSPVLIASGTIDQQTSWAETQRIYSAALPPKELWAVAGAAHVDLCQYATREYKARVLRFFSKYLRHEA
jgi:uncharacterized protein